MADHAVAHDGWLLPIRRDSGDGTILWLCHADYEAATPTDGWALWCPACRTAVSGIVAGTEGIEDLETLPEDLRESLFRLEMRIAAEHEAAMTSQPETLTSAVRTSR